MNGVPILLLLVLLLTWAAWFRTRRRNRQLAARIAAQQDRHSYTLVARESDTGRGFDVIGPGGDPLAPERLDWSADGLMVADVSDFRPGPEAGGSPAFAPGSAVTCLRDDDNPGQVDVWDADITSHAGRLPNAAAALLQLHECLVLWEHRQDGERTGLRLLLVRDDMQLES